MNPSSARFYATTATATLLWASAFAAIRRALQDYSAFHLAFLRFLVASLVLCSALRLAKIRWPERKDLLRIVLAGLLGTTLYHAGLNYGQLSVTAGSAGFIVNTVPMFTTLLAVLLLGESPPARRWLGMGLSFFGVGLITLGEHQEASIGVGGWWILLAAACQSCALTLQKPLLKKYSPAEMCCYVTWTGTMFLAVFSKGALKDIQHASVQGTLSVIYHGIFPAALANLLWTVTLSAMPASRATSYFYLIPPLSLFIAWLWLREIPGPIALAGCAFALGGVILGNLPGKAAVK